jgi:hypothetical protein
MLSNALVIELNELRFAELAKPANVESGEDILDNAETPDNELNILPAPVSEPNPLDTAANALLKDEILLLNVDRANPKLVNADRPLANEVMLENELVIDEILENADVTELIALVKLEILLNDEVTELNNELRLVNELKLPNAPAAPGNQFLFMPF